MLKLIKFLGSKYAEDKLTDILKYRAHVTKRFYGSRGVASTGRPPIGVENFKLNKVLIVTKLTRLEFEKNRLRIPNITDEKLEHILRNRGTDYDALYFYHQLHKNVEKTVMDGFRGNGIDIKVVNRLTINKDIIKWADMLVPIGGDGTFLLAADRSSPLYLEKNIKIPVVGFNSDPQRSEGRLLLPKQYSSNIEDAIKMILEGKFEWMHRSRIRITLLSPQESIPQPVDLHEYNIENVVEHDDMFTKGPNYLNNMNGGRHKADTKRILPYLALNEVFIGEKLSARVSHLQIRLDNEEKIAKTKSSGLCVTTGTGSTSWHTSINRLSEKNVDDLLKIIKKHSNTSGDIDPKFIADEYNLQLVFPPDDPRLCYSTREQIQVGVWPNPKDFESRNFARNIFVKSRCVDASLVIDGSIAYPFNDGTKALLEVHKEDALLTLTIH